MQVQIEANRLNTILQIAGRAQKRPWTVRRWIRRGLLPAIRLTGRSVYVSEEDWQAFLAAGRGRSYDEAKRATVR